MNKKKLVIFGAGAIGRGFLPWVLNFEKYEIIYVENNENLVKKLNQFKQFTTFKVVDNEYQKKIVKIKCCYSLNNFSLRNIYNIKCFIFNVGPRNVSIVAKKIIGTKIPILINENDPKTVLQVKQIVGHKKVYFSVPDVITSNTASAKHLKNDALSIITESGELFVEKNNIKLDGNYKMLSKKDLFNLQWIPKLYLHNTPHCIAAYLGSILQVKFLHQAMNNFFINEIVTGAMEEMIQSLKISWNISHKHLDYYAQKELKRFRNSLLFDPIARVAREPLRKLEIDGRLIYAAQICFSSGVIPKNILKGIVAALLYHNKLDSDCHLSFLRDAMKPKYFNTYILGLRENEPLEILLRNKTKELIEELQLLLVNNDK